MRRVLPVSSTLPWRLVRRTGLHPLLSRPPSQHRHFTDAASHPSNKTQFYLSRTLDPFLNLSIEHHLLQKTPPDSTILFIYTNRPCVVIGRNQNPWLEVNLPLIERLHHERTQLGDENALFVDLVRRRSGGGTVFHDGGNVNYSVICPPEAFDRDKHAEMVVRALQGLGVSGAKVNSRHDIVVDVGDASASDAGPGSSPQSSCEATQPQTFKVSGSAYKLTRLRSLHHGTCLLSSPNLANISSFLRSPAEPFIKARGVESVRSKVKNVGISNDEFEDGVREGFANMYGRFDLDLVVGEEAADIPNIKSGMAELRTRDWIYGQTPRFSFSTAPTEDDPRERPSRLFDSSLSLDIRQGVIRDLVIDGKTTTGPEVEANPSIQHALFYDLPSWGALLEAGGMGAAQAAHVGSWLGGLLGSSRKADNP